MNLVIDCSFVMSNISPEGNSKIIDFDSYQMYVPTIFFLECVNVLNGAFRLNRIKDEEFEKYMHILNRLPINVDRFSSSAESIYSISNLCEMHDLSSSDASYLELAMRYKAKIVTYNKNLQKACIENNVKVI